MFALWCLYVFGSVIVNSSFMLINDITQLICSCYNIYNLNVEFTAWLLAILVYSFQSKNLTVIVQNVYILAWACSCQLFISYMLTL